jgi:hypothetical protein
MGKDIHAVSSATFTSKGITKGIKQSGQKIWETYYKK